MIARGSGLYGVYCRACHGADLRGGDQGGPNLLRSDTVLNDQAGELIAPIVLKGRQGVGIMPPTPVTPDDARAIAEYIHSVAATMRGQGNPPAGHAGGFERAGRRSRGRSGVLQQRSARRAIRQRAICAASERRMSDPTTLQNYWISAGWVARGRGVRGCRAVRRDGHRRARTEKVEGTLVRIDDFYVVIELPDGTAADIPPRRWEPGGRVARSAGASQETAADLHRQGHSQRDGVSGDAEMTTRLILVTCCRARQRAGWPVAASGRSRSRGDSQAAVRLVAGVFG